MPENPIFSVTRLSDGGVAVSIQDKTVVLDPASWCKHVSSVAAQAEADAQARAELLVQAIHTDDATLREHLHNLAQRFIHAGHDVLAGFKAGVADLKAPAPAPADEAKDSDVGTGEGKPSTDPNQAPAPAPADGPAKG